MSVRCDNNNSLIIQDEQQRRGCSSKNVSSEKDRDVYNDLVRSVCVFEEKTRCNITWQSVCMSLTNIRQRQSDGQLLTEIRFQQHPQETSGGLNGPLLTLIIHISFIPFLSVLSHFNFCLSALSICFSACTSVPSLLFLLPLSQHWLPFTFYFIFYCSCSFIHSLSHCLCLSLLPYPSERGMGHI